ncbi:MAG: DUF6531 domain-containing protein [Rhodothermales bacterium]
MVLRADIATGATSLYEMDLRLPGYIPLELARRYRSNNPRKGPLGYGWTFNYDIILRVESDRIIYRDASDREIYFRLVEVGNQVTHPDEHLVLQHHPDAYIIFASPVLQQVFLKAKAKGSLYRLNRVEDLNKNTIECLYKGPHLIGFIDTAGRQVHCTYADDHLASIRVTEAGDTAHGERVRSFRYDGQGNLIAVADAARREAVYAYDDHLMVAYTNRLGGIQYARYDKERRCLALWYSDGSMVRRIAYDDLRQTTRVTDSQGAQLLCRHLGDTVLAHIDPDGRQRDYYYDEQARLIGFTTVGRDITAFQRLDPDTGTLNHLDGGERVAFFTFNASGLAEHVADGFDNQYRLAYDERGNLIRLTTPTEAVWTFERDARGRVTEVISPEERRVRLSYSKDGCTRTVTDDLGLLVEETCDLFGRITERVDALDRRQHRVYDLDGRLATVKIEGGYEVRFTYDAEGHLTGTTDSRHRDSKLRYDAFGRLVERTDPDGQRWQFQYDPEGRLVTVQRQGQTARFAYDWHGRLVQAVAFDGRTESYAYEEGGVVGVRQEDSESTRTYTPLHELTGDTLPDDTTRRFEYGPSGELLAASWGEESLTLMYDEEGRLATMDRGDATLIFAYDSDGGLQAIEGGQDPRLALRYDQRGRMTEILLGSETVAQLTYDRGDRLASLDLQTGSRYTFAYDRLDRLEERTVHAVDGTTASQRFRTKDTAVRADTLVPSLAEQDGAPVQVVLFQTRYSLVLAAQVQGLDVPIWVQQHYFAPWDTNLIPMTVRAALHGAASLLEGKTMPLGPELLRRWEKEAHERVQVGYTDVPLSRQVGRPWRMLDRRFLDRALYDATYPHKTPGFLAHHQPDPARSSDALMTGTHMNGYLKPRVWGDRSFGRDLAGVVEAHTPGGLTPDDVKRLLMEST